MRATAHNVMQTSLKVRLILRASKARLYRLKPFPNFPLIERLLCEPFDRECCRGLCRSVSTFQHLKLYGHFQSVLFPTIVNVIVDWSKHPRAGHPDCRRQPSPKTTKISSFCYPLIRSFHLNKPIMLPISISRLSYPFSMHSTGPETAPLPGGPRRLRQLLGPDPPDARVQKRSVGVRRGTSRGRR